MNECPRRVERLSKATDDCLSDTFNSFRIFCVIGERAGKLIASQPRRHGRGGDKSNYLRRHAFEQRIPYGVTVDIIDVFEMVQIEHDNRQRLLALYGAVEQSRAIE